LGFFENSQKILVSTIDHHHCTDGSTDCVYAGICGCSVYLFDILIMKKLQANIRLILINALVFLGFSSICLLALELVLRSTDKLDQSTNPAPSYIPMRYRRVDSEINSSGKTDIWGFRSSDGRDLLEELNKARSKKCRVVILGDSFVWGDGLRVGERWPDYLKNISQCEIHAFGKNGWTTLEQFAFYEGRLISKDFDHLLIGYVTNDPHLVIRLDKAYLNLPNGTSFEKYRKDGSYLTRALGGLSVFRLDSDTTTNQFINIFSKIGNDLNKFIVKPLASKLHSVDYLDQRLRAISYSLPTVTLENMNDKSDGLVVAWGYQNWREYLYSTTNFEKWSESLVKFSEIARHPVTLVLTPENNTDKDILHIKMAKQSAEKAKFNVVDCSYVNESLFGRELARPREFWANPADGHPGKEQNKGFAVCADATIKSMLK